MLGCVSSAECARRGADMHSGHTIWLAVVTQRAVAQPTPTSPLSIFGLQRMRDALIIIDLVIFESTNYSYTVNALHIICGARY